PRTPPAHPPQPPNGNPKLICRDMISLFQRGSRDLGAGGLAGPRISARGLLGRVRRSNFDFWRPMHPIPFSLKRAHHSSLAKQRKWLAQFGITPARYDLLVVIADSNASLN